MAKQKNIRRVTPGNVLITISYPENYALKKHRVNNRDYEVSEREGYDLVNIRKIAKYKQSG